MERKVLLNNSGIQNRNIFKSEQDSIYHQMEQNVSNKARECYHRKPYAACGGSTPQRLACNPMKKGNAK